jgi:AAA15 family ATPase/GTPase
MVLAYIWIENYKGFVKQGFNFASEYKFNFNINNSKLYRTSNELYIKDFFGSEVSSVIGVVGKNSSGKTNVLELVQYIVDGANTIINKPFLCVFKSGNEFKVYQYKMGEVSTDFPANLQEYPGNIPNISSMDGSITFPPKPLICPLMKCW